MKSTPLIMSGPMIQAYRQKKKRVTRRTKGLDRINIAPQNWEYDGLIEWAVHLFVNKNTHEYLRIKSPFGGENDELWFRETWALGPSARYLRDHKIHYRADGEKDFIKKWKPSIHMPRALCRHDHVKIVELRVERLQEITECDARLEGFDDDPYGWGLAHQTFAHYWEKLNGKKGLGWDKNPWIWRIEFEPYCTQ